MEREKMESEGETLGLDTGWEEVVRKKKRQSYEGRSRLDVATSIWKASFKDTFSFFFSDFSETHGAREMLKAFKFYGEAMEVVIPPKRDKWGKRFGFVRFRNVEDPKVFAIKLDNIIFGSKKIHVNIPRFQREMNGSLKPQQAQQQKKEEKRGEAGSKQQVQQRGMKQSWRKQEGGVKQIWRKKEGGDNGGRNVERQSIQNIQKIIYHRKNNVFEVCYNVPEEEMEKYKKMYVGTVRTPGCTYSVQEWFNMQGFFSIKITPMGANKVLMEELDEGVFSVLMN